MKFKLVACLALILFSCSPKNTALANDKEASQRPVVQVELPNPKAKHNVPVIIFDGRIDDDTVLEFANAFGKVEPAADVVVIELTTYGGSVDAGYRMARIIERSSTPVICVAENEVASMGYWVFESCDVRVTTKTTTLTAHYPYYPQINANKEQDIEVAYQHQRAMKEQMLQQVCGHAKLTCPEVQKILDNGDWVQTWSEALKFGTADRVTDSVETVVKLLESKGKL